MKLLVGIPSFRRPGMLAELLASLENQQGLEGVEVEVFVADNDAVRGEGLALCEALSVGYAHPLSGAVVEAKGISAARNRLLEEARNRGADFLAMIDDDETASPNWLSHLLAARDAYGADIVGGPVRYAFVKMPSKDVAMSGAFFRKLRASGAIEQIEASGNVLLCCHALANLGWPQFNCEFGLTGGEDKEYFVRLKLGGLRFAWAMDALVHETVPEERTRLGAVLRRAYGIGNSDYRIAALHGPPEAAPVHLAKSTAVLAAALPLMPALLIPRWRIWLLRRYARALGRLASALGRSSAQYGATISP